MSQTVLPNLASLPESIPRPHSVMEGVVGRSKTGDYHLVQIVGEGAAGIVCEASFHSTDCSHPAKCYALKILCPLKRIARTAKYFAQMQARFETEAIGAGRLSAANCSRAVDAGVISQTPSHDSPLGGMPFYAMEWIDGQSVVAVLKNKYVTVRRRLSWIGELAQLLSTIHAQGVLHRDVKPDNLMIDVEGKLHLVDFGVADWSGMFAPAWLPMSTGRPVPMWNYDNAELLTTWQYLAPEVELNSQRYNAAAEVWAFGKTSLEILTGAPIVRNDFLLGRFDFSAIEPVNVRQLLQSATSPNPTNRPSIDQAVAQLRDINNVSLSM